MRKNNITIRHLSLMHLPIGSVATQVTVMGFWQRDVLAVPTLQLATRSSTPVHDTR